MLIELEITGGFGDVSVEMAYSFVLAPFILHAWYLTSCRLNFSVQVGTLIIDAPCY
uniref:Uncharacterized protein n=1 Tax=Arundo donax TaxID=35708 RepID=A0A0A8YH43_ARUDO